MRTLIEIDGETFIFADDNHIARVRRDIRDAVRSGGEFVRMGESSRIEVLVTPATRIRVQEVPEPVEEEHEELDPFDELLADFDID